LRTSTLRIVLFLIDPLVTTRAYAEPAHRHEQGDEGDRHRGGGNETTNSCHGPHNPLGGPGLRYSVRPPVKARRLLAQQLVEPGDLVRGHRVPVLLLGVPAGAHLVRVRRHALDHLVAHGGVALDEAGGVPVVDAEKVVENEHLAVRGRARADPDDRDLHLRHDRLGERARDRLEDDREAAGLLQRERVVEHLERRARPCGPASGSRRGAWRSAG
jgi:hypothetical protein